MILSEVACAGDDWVELKNFADGPVALSGWALTDDVADPTRRELLSGSLAPGERRVVAVTAFGIACDETLTLLSDGPGRETTTLAVARPGATWARLPEPVTASSSFDEGLPTPGTPNQPYVVGAVRLNEIDCRGNDRVELVNAGAVAIDVGGFTLVGDPADPAQRYVLPTQSLPPGGRAVVLEADPAAVPPIVGFAFDIACTGALSLHEDGGATADAVVLERTAEAFTWGRLPDGTGDFAATVETIGAPNAPATLLAPEVFDEAVLHDLTVEVAAGDRVTLLRPSSPEVACTLRFADDAPLACDVRQDRVGRFVLAFADAARFRGLEALVVEFDDEDPTLLRAALAARAYAAATVIAPRVGFASASVAGQPARLSALVEVLDGRRLRRELASTAHIYASGPGPRDLVADDVSRWEVVVGDELVRDDLRAVAGVLAAHRDRPGVLEAAAPLLAAGASLRLLAVDAWLDHADGYARARGDVVVHVDAAGEARLLPGDLDGVLRADGPAYATGSALVDACLVDPPCADLFDAALFDVADALGAADLAGIVDRLAPMLRDRAADPATFDAAVSSLRARIIARPAEMAARIAAGAP
ncbi:MAG: lamin tail domain-containing protein [Deltaproteobacteria bacterium]|nr:lamin tail domain-containing protein [Deltaproteobacteria bacterium]